MGIYRTNGAGPGGGKNGGGDGDGNGNGNGDDCGGAGDNAPVSPFPSLDIAKIGSDSTVVRANFGDMSAGLTSRGCFHLPLKSGELLSLKWTCHRGEFDQTGYTDVWFPAGTGGVFSFLPVQSYRSHPGDYDYRELWEAGANSFSDTGSANTPNQRVVSQLDATYFTTYDQLSGTYHEYLGGSSVPVEIAGRLKRRFNPRGNEVYYHYEIVPGWNSACASLTRLSGNNLGRVTPYFEYYSPPTNEQRYRNVTKIFLYDHDNPSGSRSIYFDWNRPTTQPYLSKMVYPDGCSTLYNLNAPANGVSVQREMDAEGYTSYFAYTANDVRLTTAVEPEGRVSYFSYSAPPSFKTTKALIGRGDWVYEYIKSSSVDEMPMLNREVNPLGQTTYWTYDPTLLRVSNAVVRNGHLTYYEYLGGGGQNAYALVREVLAFNGAATYYGYEGGKYDCNKIVGPRHTPTFKDVTYYEYNPYRERVTQVDALGNATRWGRDSFGRIERTEDARGNPTYFFYGGQTGFLDATRDAEGNVAYFGYNSFGARLRQVSPLWVEAGGFASNTSYFEFDSLNRKKKAIDPLGNITYFDWTSRSDLLGVVDARGTDTEFSYNAFRLPNRRTVRDAAGTLLLDEKHGYDLYKNRTRSLDPRGNASYFFYDQIDRLTAQKDALGGTGYFFYSSIDKVTERIDPRGNPTYFFHDLLGRVTAHRDARGNCAYFFYDLGDNRTQAVDPLGRSAYFFYDELERLQTTRDALGNGTYFFYDPSGNTTEIRNGRGSTTYYFDRIDRAKAARSALGNHAYFFYDAAGNRTHRVDALGRATYFFYDGLNRRKAERNARGDLAYFFYDATGNLTSFKDPRGHATYFTFDGLNRETESIRPNSSARLLTYDVAGNVVQVKRRQELAAGYGVQAYGTSPYGGFSYTPTTYFFYDALNRQSAVAGALGNLTYFGYDPVGNRTAAKNALGHPTYFGFDGLNRMTVLQDALGISTYYEYDAVSNLTKVVDPRNNSFQTRFDALNRPDAIRAGDGGSLYFSYDEVGNRTRTLNQSGNATYFGFDAEDRLLRVHDALGRSLYFEYDAVGNVSRRVGAEGESTSIAYDAVDRATNLTYASAGSVVAAGLRGDPYFVYDAVGNVTQIGDLWGLHRRAYDSVNRPTVHQFPTGQNVYFEYDLVSNRSATVYPAAAGKARAAYDALDRQTIAQAPSGGSTYFSYNADSGLTRKVLGNQAALDVTYDNAERTARWRHSDKNGASLTYFDYERDAKGLITKAVREATHTVYYTYDASDRLTAEIWALTGASPTEVYGFRYAYDLAGNRVRARMNGEDAYYSYDPANQLTVRGTNAAYASPSYYVYDLNGSVTDLIEPSGTTKFAYNPAGLVARLLWRDASSAYFFYDGQLKRYAIIAAGVTNYFLWDGLNLLQELHADGTVKEEHTHSQTPIPGIGQLVETYRSGESAGNQMIYPVMDPRGSIHKWIKSEGTTVAASREWDAFGQIIAGSAIGNWPSHFGMQGQSWLELWSSDGNQRLLFPPFRIYDPVTGRFLQNESILSRRLFVHYLYAMQNPINMVDPFGLEEKPCGCPQEKSFWSGLWEDIKKTSGEVIHDVGQGLNRTGDLLVRTGGAVVDFAAEAGASIHDVVLTAEIKLTNLVGATDIMLEDVTYWGAPARGTQQEILRTGDKWSTIGIRELDVISRIGSLGVRDIVEKDWAAYEAYLRDEISLEEMQSRMLMAAEDQLALSFLAKVAQTPGRLNPKVTKTPCPGPQTLDELGFTQVSRWGKPGLRPGDWVMKGPADLWNYIRSFKWQPSWLPGENIPAPFGSGEKFLVPTPSVKWPWSEFYKGFFGQRRYFPTIWK